MLNVPGRTDILFHALNTVKETEGCIGPGKNTEVGKVTDSRTYEKILTDTVKAALASGDKAILQII